MTYDFAYNIRDDDTGAAFSQRETREGKSTKGEYRVKLPDGRIQVVSYVADEKGYRAKVTYEPETPKYGQKPVENNPREKVEEPKPEVKTTEKVKNHNIPPVVKNEEKPKYIVKGSPTLHPHYLDSIHATARPPYFQPLPPKSYYLPENHYLNNNKELYPHSPYAPHHSPTFPPHHHSLKPHAHPHHLTSPRHKAFRPPHITRPRPIPPYKPKPAKPKTTTTNLPQTAKARKATKAHQVITTPNPALFFEIRKIKEDKSKIDDKSKASNEKELENDDPKISKSIDSFPTIFRSSSLRPIVNPRLSPTPISIEGMPLKTTKSPVISSQRPLVSSKKDETLTKPNIQPPVSTAKPIPSNKPKEQTSIRPKSNLQSSKRAKTLSSNIKTTPTKGNKKESSFITTHKPTSKYVPRPPAFSQLPPPLTKPSQRKNRPTNAHSSKKTISPRPHHTPSHPSHRPKITHPPHYPRPSSPTAYPGPSHPPHFIGPTRPPHHPPHHPSPPPYHGPTHPSHHHPSVTRPPPYLGPTHPPPYPGPTHAPPYPGPSHPPPYPGPTHIPPYPGPGHPPPYPGPTHAPFNHHYPYPNVPSHGNPHPSGYAPFPVPFFMPQYGPLYYNPLYRQGYQKPLHPPKHPSTRPPKNKKKS